jgi:lysophospholipase L1-like esterase
MFDTVVTFDNRFPLSMNIPPSPSKRVALTLALVSSALSGIVFAAPAPLQLKDNDVWVMAGDSITAQRLHSNFIEAYYRTRFPHMRLHFRNSGIGGNRTSSILARFDYDVAAWKPTIVSIELGMNDVGGSEEDYIRGMKELITKIRAIPAQPVLISSSPVDDGSLMGDWRSPRCEKIHPFTEALQKLAEQENVLFVDQYHPLIDVWGNNRRKGAEAAAAKAASQPQAPVAAPVLPPAPPKAPPIPPGLVPLGGDPVHPGAVGQYMMAANILKSLHAPEAVSSAVLSAEGKVASTKGCKITGVAVKEGKLTFTRLDETGPWPILPAARSMLELMPSALSLSEYELKVTGLADGLHRVSINGQPAGEVSARDLAAGWNLSGVFDGALGERSAAVAGLISKLQSGLNNNWRAASKAKDTEKLEVAQREITEAEEDLQKLVQPVALNIEIELAPIVR